MKKCLRGTLRLAVLGASPERCFNRWSRANLPFWSLEKKSELIFHCTAYRSDLQMLRGEAARAQCELQILGLYGLPTLLARVRRRSVLTFGLLLSVAAVLYLQSFVWFIRVDGNSGVRTETILQALSEEGVRFGAKGAEIDSEDLKNRMLNRIPKLSWIAVNRSGGVLTVLCAERETVQPPLDQRGLANVVASRPGVIREINVINGFSELKPGDAVRTGDVLISGVMEWTTRIQMTHASGEVFADSFRALVLSCPASVWKKHYTGRTERCVTIIFQRKRRKISGNSGIFGTMCDRMVETSEWTLPGGWTLPIRIETVTLREYVLEPVSVTPSEANCLLDAEALRLTEDDMIAGKVRARVTKLQKREDGYICQADLNCTELISRTVPFEPFGEEEVHGEVNQRGTD